jgi:hypothetical protein
MRGVMLCRSHSHGTIIGLRALPVYKAPAALRIASPQEGVVIHPVTPVTFPVFLHCPFPQTMTVPSVDQVVTAIDQLQSIVELVSYNWTYIRGRIPQSIRSPDIDELQAVPRLMDNYTGFTEPPQGACAPVQCEGFRYGLGAPAATR